MQGFLFRQSLNLSKPINPQIRFFKRPFFYSFLSQEELSLSSGGKERLSNDVLGIIKGLGFYKKSDQAMSVFKNRNGGESVE